MGDLIRELRSLAIAFPVCGKAADELARLRAEVEQARRTADHWKAEHIAGNAVIDELRRRIVEAVVVQVDQIYPVSLHGIGAIDCVTIRLIGSDAKAVGGKRVALVVLDAEEAK